MFMDLELQSRGKDEISRQQQQREFLQQQRLQNQWNLLTFYSKSIDWLTILLSAQFPLVYGILGGMRIYNCRLFLYSAVKWCSAHISKELLHALMWLEPRSQRFTFTCLSNFATFVALTALWLSKFAFLLIACSMLPLLSCQSSLCSTSRQLQLPKVLCYCCKICFCCFCCQLRF